MVPTSPKITVGLPVRQGEAFLGKAVDSILAQTFEDFELVICDNASTDATPAICADFARRDSRVRVLRSERNLGAAPNFNVALREARGTYFRWHAHDDLVLPTYLERCNAVLDSRPEVVLCHTRVEVIDAAGAHLYYYRYGPRTDSPFPRRRFRDLLFVRNHCYEVFGLIRTAVLRETGWMGAFPVGDRVLLSELAFRGRFHEIQEPLFLSRDHEQRSVRVHVSQQERASWFDSRYEGRITLPEWRTLAEYWKAIRRAPLSRADRLACELYMLDWIRHYRKRMRHDVAVAAAGLGTKLVRHTLRPSRHEQMESSS